MNFLRRVALAALFVLLGVVLGRSTEQHSVMVWDGSNQKTCPFTVTPTSRTRLVEPMVNGQPDAKEARLEHVVVEFRAECGYVEVQRW